MGNLKGSVLIKKEKCCRKEFSVSSAPFILLHRFLFAGGGDGDVCDVANAYDEEEEMVTKGF